MEEFVQTIFTALLASALVTSQDQFVTDQMLYNATVKSLISASKNRSPRKGTYLLGDLVYRHCVKSAVRYSQLQIE